MEPTKSHIPGTNMPVSATTADVTTALRASLFTARATARKQAFDAERTLKGMYMSWVFGKLNLADRV